MKLLTNNISIYNTSSGLYVATESGSLIQLRGSETSMISSIIQLCQNPIDIYQLYQSLKMDIQLDMEYMNEIVEYLVNLNIIKKIENVGLINPLRILFVGSFSDGVNSTLDMYKSEKEGIEIVISNYTGSRSLEHIKTKLNNIDMVISMVPTLHEYNNWLSVESELKRRSIPILLTNLQYMTFDIGPIIDYTKSKLSILCYLNRVLATSAQPNKCLEFILHEDRELINSRLVDQNKYFMVALGIIINEAKRFLLEKSSCLIERSTSFNMLNYTTNHVRILPTNFNLSNVYPFNA